MLASGENPLDATQKASSESSMALECMENARLTKEKERLVGIFEVQSLIRERVVFECLLFAVVFIFLY